MRFCFYFCFLPQMHKCNRTDFIETNLKPALVECKYLSMFFGMTKKKNKCTHWKVQEIKQTFCKNVLQRLKNTMLITKTKNKTTTTTKKKKKRKKERIKRIKRKKTFWTYEKRIKMPQFYVSLLV